MVVWQGITEGGTAVPVQITEEGKVVAIGESGPRGPEGPEGPPGPKGQAEWPPNPIEGAFLVWLNGEPTWYTEQPIPTPPGSQGPIIQVDSNSLLLFDSDVDQNIFFNGVQVYAINANGSKWNGDGQYNADEVWSQEGVLGPPGAFTGGNYAYSNIFNGDLNNSWLPTSDGSTPGGRQTYTFNTPIAATEVQILGIRSTSASNFQINGSNTAFPADDTERWFNVSSLLTDGKLISISAEYVPGSGSAIKAVKVNGRILLDTLAGPYPTGQVSTVANNSALLSRVQGVWTAGLYMKADEGAMAAWLISKRRNG